MSSSGFTLIEVLIGVTIMTIAILLVGSFGLNIFESQITFSRTLEIQQEVNQTFSEILPEARSIRPSDSGSYPIAGAEENVFEFYSDVDSDGSAEKIRYFLDGSILKRGETKASGNPPVYDPSDEKIKNLIHDIDNGANPAFKYYGKNFTGTEPPLDFPVNIADIGLVRIEVRVEPNIPESSAITFSMQATPRNLR